MKIVIDSNIAVALAAQEGAAFWTADRRLAQNAQKAVYDWVHYIKDS